METIEVLRAVPVFAALEAPVLEAVASRTVARSYARNGRVFRQAEPCQGLFVVVEGRVRIYRANREGREQVLHLRGPGQTLAEVPLFDGGPYPACARAEEDSRLLFLPAAEFHQLCRGYPEIADATIRELGRRLRRMVGLVEKISLKEVPAEGAIDQRGTHVRIVNLDRLQAAAWSS